MTTLRLLIICWVLTGCANSLQPPEVTLIGLAPAGTILDPAVRVDLRLDNPNSRALPVRSMSFDLNVNGQPLARGLSEAPFRIPANGQAQTSLVVSTQVTDLLRQLSQIQGRRSIDYQLQGRLQLDGALPISIPFRRAGALQLQ